ncbi:MULTISPECIES: TniB family NTP-binding protein [unclassified Neptuniibacter]|uniref:TniB family NTP-binding protein n=1 Tax=unclassified Neptuniibacter TaxID=2630693 RepID=UPI0025F60F8E|nr:MULTISPECIES: TniB family NTP-binding protein [unclassified Neptuniibacter]|tara:strand:+ start:25164 stop:26141 length:978 start_codon:yes stop_codon:yes gene_type:complete
MSNAVDRLETVAEELGVDTDSLKPETCNFVSRIIRYPKMDEALKLIDGGRKHAVASGKGTGMLLLGEPGVGKSVIIGKYVQEYFGVPKANESDVLTKCPVLKLSVPAKATVTSLLSKILRAAKHPKPTGSYSELVGRIETLVQEQGVQMIILDEFQHLLRRQAQISTRNVVNEIKVLMDDHGLAILLCGITDGFDLISEHEELYQRFTYEQIALTPFDVQTEEEHAAFKAYINVCCMIVKDSGVKCIDLTSKTMLQRLLLATAGKARLINRLFVKVLETSDLSKGINNADFHDAYERARLNPKIGMKNPFKMSPSKVNETCGWYK